MQPPTRHPAPAACLTLGTKLLQLAPARSVPLAQTPSDFLLNGCCRGEPVNFGIEQWVPTQLESLIKPVQGVTMARVSSKSARDV